ncbi:MAG: hypothetical protein C4289_14875, partial [Chloroflexota bacterium]
CEFFEAIGKEKTVADRSTPRPVVRDYLRVLVDACPPDRWRRIVEKAVALAEQGDAQARAWLARYLCGSGTVSASLTPREEYEQRVRDLSELKIGDPVVHINHGIGRYMGTTALYYNRNWFQEKGVPFPDESWDWDRYREAMVRLSEPQNGRWGAYLILGADRRQAKVHQNGGRFVDPNDDMKSLLHTDPVIEAYQWIQDRMWKENSAIRQDQRGQPMVGARDLFLQGKVAMWEDGSWSLVPVLRNQTAGFDWDVAVLPRGRVQRDVLGTTDGFAMWVDTKYPDQAWTLLMFLNSDDFYSIQARRLQPARLSWQDRWAQYIVQDNPGLQGKNLRAFTDPIKQGYARPWNLFRYHAAVNQLINDAYEESVNLNLKPIRDTHMALSRQIDEIQQRECAADPNCRKR